MPDLGGYVCTRHGRLSTAAPRAAELSNVIVDRRHRATSSRTNLWNSSGGSKNCLCGGSYDELNPSNSLSPIRLNGCCWETAKKHELRIRW